MEIPAPTSEGAAPKIEIEKPPLSEWLLDYSSAGNWGTISTPNSFAI